MALSRDELLRRARSGIREVDAAALRQLASSPEAPLILDVREPEEVDAGIIPGSRHIARGLLEMVIEEAVPDRGRPITVVCTGGNRSLLAAMTLVDMGYCDVTSLAGGFEAWKAAGHPVDVDKPLSRSERHRYARHLSLPMVGEAGQKKLLAAKVLLVGAGGLGSPCGYYLAAAGVGTLGIVDDDVVDTSNLQRQILHRDEDQGKLKADSAERALKGLNPGVTVVKHVTRMRASHGSDQSHPGRGPSARRAALAV